MKRWLRKFRTAGRRTVAGVKLRRAVESFEDLAHALQTVAVKEG